MKITQLTWAIRLALGLALLAMLSACGPTKPNLPQLPTTVTKVVEKDRDYPSWATEPLPEPQPIDSTLGALETSHRQRGDVNHYSNCIRELLRRLGRGEDVDPKTCGEPPGKLP